VEGLFGGEEFEFLLVGAQNLGHKCQIAFFLATVSTRSFFVVVEMDDLKGKKSAFLSNGSPKRGFI